MARSLFNATAGHAASDRKIEETSNQIAADIDNILDDPTVSRQVKENLLQRIAEVVADPENVTAFAAGTYTQATDSTGAPARALGSGTGSAGAVTPREALQILLSAPESEVSNDKKQFLRRALTVGDPDYIQVDTAGTPVRITVLEGQVRSLTTERDNARTALANERDDTVAGSLAQRLKDATSGTRPLPAADMVAKADLTPIVRKLGCLDTARASGLRNNDSVIPSTPAADLKGALGELKRLTS